MYIEENEYNVELHKLIPLKSVENENSSVKFSTNAIFFKSVQKQTK